jgi:RNA polymerase sigma factor (sigma-70 family)
MTENNKSEFLQAAFDARPVLTAYAYSLLKDWGMAQDVFQDAVISMNEKHEDILSNTPLKWLKSVIRNKSIDLIRKRQRTASVNSQLSLFLDTKFDELLNKENVQLIKQKELALHSCMSKMNTDSRGIIIDFYKSKMPCEKIGTLYQKSTNAIRLILSRSRTQLRHCVKKQMEKS